MDHMLYMKSYLKLNPGPYIQSILRNHSDPDSPNIHSAREDLDRNFCRTFFQFFSNCTLPVNVHDPRLRFTSGHNCPLKEPNWNGVKVAQIQQPKIQKLISSRMSRILSEQYFGYGIRNYCNRIIINLVKLKIFVYPETKKSTLKVYNLTYI